VGVENMFKNIETNRTKAPLTDTEGATKKIFKHLLKKQNKKHTKRR
jgi:hypothetical protein